MPGWATSASPTARAPNRRIVRHGPSTASGRTTALTREPSGRRASTRGLDRSTWSPSGATMRSMSASAVALVDLDRGALEAPAALDPHLAAAVEHDLVDRGVGEQRLERPETVDPGPHPLDDRRRPSSPGAAGRGRGPGNAAAPADHPVSPRDPRCRADPGGAPRPGSRSAAVDDGTASGGTTQRPLEPTGHPPPEHAGVGGPGDLGIDRDLGHHRRADHVLDLPTAEAPGPAR